MKHTRAPRLATFHLPKLSTTTPNDVSFRLAPCGEAHELGRAVATDQLRVLFLKYPEFPSEPEGTMHEKQAASSQRHAPHSRYERALIELSA